MEALAPVSTVSDSEVVARVRAGDAPLFEILMRRHNQRLYRVARAILKNDAEVEDVMQQAYVHAFVHLDQFEGRSQLSTWLTRIAIHEALGRRRKHRLEPWPIEYDGEVMSQPDTAQSDPERLAYAGELRALLETSIDALPDTYRLVFVCREVERAVAHLGDGSRL